MTKKHLFKIERPNEETVDFYVNGEHVGNANHDEHGWSGMSAAVNLFRSVAKQIGAEIDNAS